MTIQDQCTSASDTIQITTSNMPPLLDLPSMLTICQGQSLNIEANVSGVSYLWSDNTTSSSLQVTQPGVYSLTISNACGSDSDTIVIIDGGSLPFIDLGNDIQVCPGDSQTIVPDLNNVQSWVWHDGSTSASFIVQDTGLIAIEVSSGCGSASDTLYVSLLPDIPLLHLGNDTALCPDEMLLLEIDIPDVSIIWFDGSDGDQITLEGSGVYYAEIENACGTSSDTLVVTALPAIPLLTLGSDQLLCPGELITLNPGIPDVLYEWHDGSTGSVFSTTEAGQITLTIANACGESADTLLIIESTEGPQLDLGADVMACKGDTVTIHAGVAGVSYLWQDGSTDPFFQVIDDVLLSLHISNACGEDDDTIRVHFINPPAPDLGEDTILCGQEVLTLQANADHETTIFWQDGSESANYVVAISGMYSLQLSNFCGVESDSILITFLDAPLPFSLGPDQVLCGDESIILHAPMTMDHLLWQDGSDSSMILVDTGQLYSLTISNACGMAYDDVMVTIDLNVPTIVFDSLLICPGDVLTLDASQPFDADYLWSTGASNASIDILHPGGYTVTIMTDCYTVSEILHVFAGNVCDDDVQFFIPNVFSPNDDQVNDVFQIYFNEDTEVISVTGDIFDRWGNHIFNSIEHPFSWDGKSKGKSLNPGVYIYKLTLVYSNGLSIVTESVIGDVTLLR